MAYPSLSRLASLPVVRSYLTAVSEHEPFLESLDFDSRSLSSRSLFFALPGTHTDGHRFLDDAHARGCRAVVVTRVPQPRRNDTFYLVVDDARSAMSPLSAEFYGHPSKDIPVVGVTGTDGKSSTVWFIQQLFELSGRASGFFSTVQWQTGETVEKNALRQSTPEAPQIQNLLRRMIDSGKRYAVLESTSHGLSPLTSRLADVRYFCAVLTNVTSEHLEFHGDLETYRRDKARLFSALPDRGAPEAFGVVNADDPHHRLFTEAAGNRTVHLYSTRNSGVELLAENVRETGASLEVDLVWRGRSFSTNLPMPGRFNVENLLGALLAVSGTISRIEAQEVTPMDLVPYVPRLSAVKGRMKPIDCGQPFTVIVDYAHTPGAFEKLLPSARAGCHGRLIVVFGSGGERDRDKRPRQGELADRWADLIVLTDEDPRLEGSEPILNDIAAGFRSKILGSTYWKIPFRPEAVRFAVGQALPGDTILLLGKGHEQSIVGAAGSAPYDEESTVREALAEKGWSL